MTSSIHAVKSSSLLLHAFTRLRPRTSSTASISFYKIRRNHTKDYLLCRVTSRGGFRSFSSVAQIDQSFAKVASEKEASDSSAKKQTQEDPSAPTRFRDVSHVHFVRLETTED